MRDESFVAWMEKRYWRLQLFTLSLAAMFYGYLIWNMRLVIDGVWYWVLFDDAMISMRYAKNLVDGYGLVWNHGEYVEGYSNFLWTIWMAVIHLVPVDSSKVSLLVMITGMIILLVQIWVSFKLGELLGGNKRVGLLSGVLTGFSYLFVLWTLQGMEIGLISLLMSLSVWFLLGKNTVTHKWRFWLGICLGGLLLTRDDTLLFVGWLLLWGWWQYPDLRKSFVWLGIWSGVAIGGHELFRWMYYGDLLPNTYYLKVVGISIEDRFLRGLKWLGFALGNYLLPIGVFGLVGVVQFRKDIHQGIFFILGIVLLQCLYSVWVGGDVWEEIGNRFLVVILPLGLTAVSVVLIRSIELLFPERWRFDLGFGILVLVISTGMLGYLIDRTYNFHSDNQAISRSHIELGLYVDRITDKDFTFGVVSAGIAPYFSERRAVDMLGKMDPVIAHLSPMVRGHDFIPGHVKWNYQRSLGELRPDMFVGFFRLYGGYDMDKDIHYAYSIGYLQMKNGFWVNTESELVDELKWQRF